MEVSKQTYNNIKKILNVENQDLIRTTTLNSINTDSLLNNQEELKQFMVKTIEKVEDVKMCRIISLLFRSISHIDVVKEQNDIFFRKT